MRGYATYKRVQEQLSATRLKKNFEYFESIKKDLQTDAQRKIRFQWKLKKRREVLKEQVAKPSK